MQVVMTPREIVQELDKYIIGQDNAKKAVAIALRNRWRRMQIQDENLRNEILPKNILMIGPTGVGKTEIARRLAKLADAPFIKVEATKFTEVGYVGRDVESIIRDLADIAIKDAREAAINGVENLAEERARERILDVLVPVSKSSFTNDPNQKKEESAARKLFKNKLLQGDLDHQEIEIEVTIPVGVEIIAPPGMEEMTSQLQNMLHNIGGDKKRKRKLTVNQAFLVLKEEEASKLINDEDLKSKAIRNVEQNGIVFIDELDKVTRRSSERAVGADVSREGVQRDLLPIVEGSTVFTKYGMIKTDHILFIASGAFHISKPSDLIPELQGRFPIRVELKDITANDFERILIEPEASLTKQYVTLMFTENLILSFSKKAIRRIAEVAWHVNERTENIGARRLYTVMEKLLEDVAFTATDKSGDTMVIDDVYVDKQLSDLVKDEDLARYIL